MSRYVTRPVRAKRTRCDWLDDETPLVPHITVDDHDTVETGLLNASGEMIYRLPNPMGFGRDGEW